MHTYNAYTHEYINIPVCVCVCVYLYSHKQGIINDECEKW